MTTAGPTPTARQGACRARRPKHASKARGFCRTHHSASGLVGTSVGRVRVGGLVFLQTDPVPGGSANAYDYCKQDPINCTDLNGEFGWHSITHFVRKHWRGIVQVGVFGACMALSAGACMVAGVAAAAATNYHYRRGGMDWKGFGRDAGVAVAGGVIGRATTGSWSENAVQRFGDHSAGYSHYYVKPVNRVATALNMGQAGLYGLAPFIWNLNLSLMF
jgi:hypothetical protein